MDKVSTDDEFSVNCVSFCLNADDAGRMVKCGLIATAEDARFHVTIGKKYRVHAFCIMRGMPLFYIVDDFFMADDFHPAVQRWVPIQLFEISNVPFPSTWVVNCCPGNPDLSLTVAPANWFSDYFRRMNRDD